MVSDEVVVAVLTLSLLLHAVMAHLVGQRVQANAAALANTLERLGDSLGSDVAVDEVVQGIGGELTAVVEDILGSMHVPTAADHMMGALSMAAQAWVARSMGLTPQGAPADSAPELPPLEEPNP